MVSYPESMTDPSYAGQILVFTYPLIGNYGVPEKKEVDGILYSQESEHIHPKAIIVAEYSDRCNHWESVKSLESWLKEERVPAITGIDTRALTKRLREKGTLLGKIIFKEEHQQIPFVNPNETNLVETVSVKQKQIIGTGQLHILVIDCGMKHGILRYLHNEQTTLVRVPWDYDFTKEKEIYDGIFISNGPGDPKQCGVTISNLKEVLDDNIPIFGICLGIQLLALATGADTYKLKYGHRSQNQPCTEQTTQDCFITAQNHGFAVDQKTLSSEWHVWFSNTNDGTVEGIKHATKPFSAVQFHPEASGGPRDTVWLFDRFLDQIKQFHEMKVVKFYEH